jgi:hypothetical protein
MKALKNVLILAGAVTVLTGAAVDSSAGQQDSRSLPPVIVDNTRDVPVLVYLERGSFDTRLGTVPPHSREALPLPAFVTIGSEVQVFVHPEGEMDLASSLFTVEPGNELVLMVPASNVGYVPPPRHAEIIPDPGVGATTVTVMNPRNVPVTLFLDRGVFDTRIGTVPANSELTLAIPEQLADEGGTAEFFIHPEKELDLASQSFELKPGAHFLLRVPVK